MNCSQMRQILRMFMLGTNYTVSSVERTGDTFTITIKDMEYKRKSFTRTVTMSNTLQEIKDMCDAIRNPY